MIIFLVGFVKVEARMFSEYIEQALLARGGERIGEERDWESDKAFCCCLWRASWANWILVLRKRIGDRKRERKN